MQAVPQWQWCMHGAQSRSDAVGAVTPLASRPSVEAVKPMPPSFTGSTEPVHSLAGLRLPSVEVVHALGAVVELGVSPVHEGEERGDHLQPTGNHTRELFL